MGGPAIKTETVREQVLSRVRGDIVGGKFAVGTPLRIDVIAAELGVSHMPVREALHILAMEGLLTRRPRRGVVVNGLEPEDLRSAYEVMAVMEGMAARHAAERVDTDGLKTLKAINDRIKRELGRGDAAAVLASNREFHELLYASCQNRWIVEFLRQLWNYTYRVRARHPRSMKRANRSVKEHDELLRAVESRDGGKAESLAVKHCLLSLDDLLEQV